MPVESLKGRRWPAPSWWRRLRTLVVGGQRFTMANLTDILAELWEERPVFFLERPLEYSFFRGDEISFRTLWRFVGRIGHGLTALGVRRGDRVGLVTANRVELAFAEFACQKLGAIPVPFNYMLRAAELRYLAENCGCRVLITDRTVFEQNIRDRAALPSIEHWVMVTAREVPPGFVSLSELIADEPDELAPVNLHPDDVAIIFYTAGTTGLPKGAMLTNAGLMFAFRRVARLTGLLPYLPRQLSLLVMPLAHTSGHQALLLHLALATPSLFVGRFQPEEVLAAIEKHGVTMFAGIPAMYRMLEDAGAAERDLSSLWVLGGGGDAFPDELVARWREMAARRWLGVKIRPIFVRGYGMAETCGQVSVARPGPQGEGCIGLVMRGLSYRIVNGQGRDVPRGEVGELVLKGPTVMKGYWNDPERTREAFIDGWFRTGDLVRQGPRGRLYMAAREKEVIKVGGYSVFPAEVEREMEEHPAIERVAVVGLPHPVKGERPVAAVTLRPEAKVSEEELLAWARERIAPYKCPREVIILDAIPVNFAMKALRREVRDIILRQRTAAGEGGQAAGGSSAGRG